MKRALLLLVLVTGCSSSDSGADATTAASAGGSGGTGGVSAGAGGATGGHAGAAAAGHAGAGGAAAGHAGAGGAAAGHAGAGGAAAGHAGAGGAAAGHAGAGGAAAGHAGAGGAAAGHAGTGGAGGTHTGGTPGGGAGGAIGGSGGVSAGGSPNTGGGGTSSGGAGAGGSVGGGAGGFAGAGGQAGPSSTRQTARPLGSTAAKNGFFEYLPPGYGESSQYPLLVFWHGVGEDGNGTSDLSKVLAHGPPMLISKDQWPNDRPFVVLSPQNASNCPSSGAIHDFFTFAQATYSIDPKRVYLTGLSCGAIGSWQYINANHATQIAAAVLMSGDPGDPANAGSAWGHSGCGLGEVALWAFHGDKDTTVNITNEETTMNDLLACPSPPRRDAKWNIIAGGGHVIWDPIYDTSAGFDIYGFLLQNPHP